MHYVMEVILPPTETIEADIAAILSPFREESDKEDASSAPFYDWYVIGGRWAGNKLQARLGEENIQAFREKLIDMGITVSALSAGKQSLSPESQIPTVDALWRDMFPGCGFDKCPLFSHSNDQYSNERIIGDACKLSELPSDYTACRVIIAARSFGYTLEAVHMAQDSFWNGVNHVKTTWNGNVLSALNDFKEQTKNYKDDYRDKITPKDDWLVVTVDYHS